MRVGVVLVGLSLTLVLALGRSDAQPLGGPFQTNSFTLDAKALSDIDRLRDLLLTPDYASRSVMLIGYADNMGPFPNNLKLSDRRAGAVARALAKASGGKIPAAQLALRAYGELAPVACNDSFEARSLNRRVEVWVK